MDKNLGMVNIGKWLKWVVYLGIFIPILIGIISSYSKGNCSNGKIYFIEKEIFGTILKKYIDPLNHNGETLIISSNRKIHMISQLEVEIFNALEVGDSLAKKSNSRFLTLYKISGKKIEFEETEVDCEYLLK